MPMFLGVIVQLLSTMLSKTVSRHYCCSEGAAWAAISTWDTDGGSACLLNVALQMQASD